MYQPLKSITTAKQLGRNGELDDEEEMVRKERLELSQVTLLVPKTSASTNSATFALIRVF